MNLIYGEITEIVDENGMRIGKVRVGAAVQKVPLELLTNAQAGDRVLLCDGIAISKVDEMTKSE